jgi:hypothetical protein
MFNFFSRHPTRYPSIREALVQSGVAAAGDPSQVAVVEKRGKYSDRGVNFFRAFAPGHEDIVLGSGHVEHEGLVMVDLRRPPEGAVPARELADRALHADDERLVFWDARLASSSEALLSAPAATWLQARSTAAPHGLHTD